MTVAALAFDLGAESGRAMAGEFDGERLSLREIHRFPTRSIERPDGLYWDAAALFSEIEAGLAVGSQERDLRSVGVDSWAVDFGLLDADGQLIGNPFCYRDGRGAHAMEAALARVPAAELYETTGIQLLSINTVFQLLAEDRLDRAETMLLMPDLVGYWLTGERVAEATNASTTQLLDARTGDWSDELIDRLGLPRRIFPQVVAPGTILGDLRSDATPVVSVASHDTASAVVAAPLAGEGSAFISSGTWSLVGVELDAPVLSEVAREANLTNERGFGGTTRLLKNVMGLWLLQECRRAWNAEGRRVEYDELVALAESAPSSFLFDPDLPELLAPGDMPARIRAAADVGACDIDVMSRSIFESLACKYRVALDQLEAATGVPIRIVNVIGGGARNAYLCRLTANLTGRTVFAGPAEAAALGNVLVQLHAFGEAASLVEMRKIVTASTQLERYEPDGRRGPWDDLYGRFTELLRPKAVA